jgi:hypothetical protein
MATRDVEGDMILVAVAAGGTDFESRSRQPPGQFRQVVKGATGRACREQGRPSWDSLPSSSDVRRLSSGFGGSRSG